MTHAGGSLPKSPELPPTRNPIPSFYSLSKKIRSEIAHLIKHPHDMKLEDQKLPLENLHLSVGRIAFHFYLLNQQGEPAYVIFEEIAPSNIFQRSTDLEFLAEWSSTEYFKNKGWITEIGTGYTEFSSPDGLQSVTLLQCTDKEDNKYKEIVLINLYDGLQPKGEQSRKVGLILTTMEDETLFFILPSAQIPNVEQP